MTTLIFKNYLTGKEPVECQNCDWTGFASDLLSICDAEERIFPGEIVPAGECPDCGALAHLNEENTTEGQATSGLLAALELAETTIQGTLNSRGYRHGEDVSEWDASVKAELAALVPIRAAIAKAKAGTS